MGARALETGIWGGDQNVMINMQDITDAAFKSRITKKAEAIERRAVKECAEVLEPLEGR